jgi:protein required for attachment to host cells
MFVNEAKNAKGLDAVFYVKDIPYATNVVVGLPTLLTTQMKTISEFITIAKPKTLIFRRCYRKLVSNNPLGFITKDSKQHSFIAALADCNFAIWILLC